MAPSRTADAGVRDRILRSALELFAAYGYDATSVQQVVVHAGVTKGALYHYFMAKEDLLFEIYTTFFADLLAGLERIVDADTDPPAKLRAIIAHTVVGVAENIETNAVLSREVSRLDDERWARLQADWRRYQDAVRHIIRDGQLTGYFSAVTSPEVVTWSIFGVTNTMHTWYRPDGPKTPQAIAQELADLVLKGLSAAPS